MNITILLREAFANIMNNKMRSILTMIGIFIGVSVVISLVSIGEGVFNSITDSMSALGTNDLYITPGNPTENVRNAKDISNEDVNAIAELDCIEKIAPIISQTFLITQQNGNSTNSTVTGIVPDYYTIGNYTMAQGVFITRDSVDNKRMVVVIGSEINETLFGDENYKSVGEKIRILDQSYNIIGVLKKKGSTAMGVSQDRTVFIPLSTAQYRLMPQYKNCVSQIIALITPDFTLASAKESIENLLRENHGTFTGKPNDFKIKNKQEMVNTLNNIIKTFTLFLSGVAAISLVVGGIGIMNIMLVTVRERTREIGLRKALGARKIDILMQFLIESLIISLFGGVLGILFGIGLAYCIAKIAYTMGTNLKININYFVIILSTLFSVADGLFFGIYPALQASKLDPVVALRSE